jgi:hypothetical protein
MKTITGLTGQKGLSETFKSGVDMLELVSKKIECDDGVERARPSGMGNLKLIGEQPILVSIPSYDPNKAILADANDSDRPIADVLDDLLLDLDKPKNKKKTA